MMTYPLQDCINRKSKVYAIVNFLQLLVTRHSTCTAWPQNASNISKLTQPRNLSHCIVCIVLVALLLWLTQMCVQPILNPKHNNTCEMFTENSCSSFKDPSVLPTIHPLVEFLRGWLILNLENIHSRTTAPTSVNTFVQTPRNCQFLTMLREIRSQTSLNDDYLYLVNHTIAPLIRFSVQTANDDHPINQRAHWSIPMDWTSQASFTFDIFPENICLEDIRVLFGLWQCSDWILRECLCWRRCDLIAPAKHWFTVHP